MADAPPPTPTPAAPGNIFEGYQKGDPTDMFAPAYIKGFAPSTEALAAWNAYNHQPGIVEASRMPNLYVDPAASPMSAGDGVYGGPIPLQQTYGDNRGMVDPEALRVAAQGGHYDIEGRRAAIAARLAENERLRAPKAIEALVDATKPARDPMEMYRWPYAGDQS
jgi:hypothetical protein